MSVGNNLFGSLEVHVVLDSICPGGPAASTCFVPSACSSGCPSGSTLEAGAVGMACQVMHQRLNIWGAYFWKAA